MKKSYDMSVDVFALGTMLYELYTGDIPYHGIDPADIKDRVLKDSSLPYKIGMKKSISQICNNKIIQWIDVEVQIQVIDLV